MEKSKERSKQFVAIEFHSITKIVPTIYFKTMSSLLDGVQKPKERKKIYRMKPEEFSYVIDRLKQSKRKLTDIIPTDKVRNLLLMRLMSSCKAQLGSSYADSRAKISNNSLFKECSSCTIYDIKMSSAIWRYSRFRVLIITLCSI